MKINHPENNDAEGEPPPCLRVGVTYNIKKNIPSALPDAEAEADNEETIGAIQNVLEAAGHTVILFEAASELPSRLLEEKPDIVFNIAEGINGRGREAQVPAILNFLRIPFTGSDETTMCVSMDKALCKKIVSALGICTPPYMVARFGAPLKDLNLDFPLIIKPNSEGSSKGISDCSVVNDEGELRRVLEEKLDAYRQDMLIEEYIQGREFTVGLLGNGERLRIFPPMEIIFKDKAHSIYSYEVKRNFGEYVRYECPPDLNSALRKEIENSSETIYRFLQCRDMARMDFRLSRESKLHFMEVNPLPGLAPEYSDLPIIAAFCGMDHASLIRYILDSALERYGMPCNTKQG